MSLSLWCCSQIVLSLTLESVDGSNFFDEDKIIDNLAALLGVSKDKIKIAKIVSEGNLEETFRLSDDYHPKIIAS